MKRTLIQFDEDTYDKLRHRAFDEKRSISSVARELIAKSLEPRRAKKRVRIEQFSSIGAGRSKQGKLSPVSERHDEALAEIYYAEAHKK
jgi:predicted CopG family antitoxin